MYSLPASIHSWIFGMGGVGETIFTYLNMSFTAAKGTLLNPVPMTTSLLDAIEALCEGWIWRDNNCKILYSRVLSGSQQVRGLPTHTPTHTHTHAHTHAYTHRVLTILSP